MRRDHLLISRGINMTNQYHAPKVWEMDQESGGIWASINRPDSGARHQQELPIGQHPIHPYQIHSQNKNQRQTQRLKQLGLVFFLIGRQKNLPSILLLFISLKISKN